MSFAELNNLDKEKYIATLVLKNLQELGGQAERSEIRERILDSDEEIAQYANEVRVSKKTNSEWHPFAYKFNFALKNLQISNYLTYSRGNPSVQLTEKGINVNINEFDITRDVYDVSEAYWHNNPKRSKNKNEEDGDDEVNIADKYQEDFKQKLLKSISEMSPAKFELFSRLLLKKMGVEFTEVGTQISNDGGIDGYGYCRTDDFRTSRVVIQCKRWQGNVGSVEIDQFLGAMNKFQADYGIFITNSRYTPAAREAARAGTPITLIDGDELVRLVKKYQLYIYPVTTYELDGFYDTES